MKINTFTAEGELNQDVLNRPKTANEVWAERVKLKKRTGLSDADARREVGDDDPALAFANQHTPSEPWIDR